MRSIGSIHKHSKRLGTILLLIILSLALFSTCYSCAEYFKSEQSVKLYQDQYINSSYLQVIDQYDQDGQMNFGDFLNQVGSLQDLQNANEAFHNMTEFVFYEMNRDPVHYLGKYTGDTKFVPYYEHDPEQVNKKVLQDGQVTIMTPLYSTQLSAESVEHLRLSEQISSGRIFLPQDYFYQPNQNIPVLMGYEYKEYYQLGDIVQCEYFGKMITCEVIGFLKEDTLNSFAQTLIYLDRDIILPSLCPATTDINQSDEEFWKMLYGQKNWGYYEYHNMEEYEKITNIVHTVSTQTSIPYTVQDSIVTASTTNNISTAAMTIRMMMLVAALFAILLFSIFLVLYYKLLYIKMQEWKIHLICAANYTKIRLVQLGRIAGLFAGALMLATVLFCLTVDPGIRYLLPSFAPFQIVVLVYLGLFVTCILLAIMMMYRNLGLFGGNI